MLPTTRDTQADGRIGQTCNRYKRCFRAQTHSTNMGGEQDVQYDRALITGQRIVQTERNMSNLQKNDVDEYNITLFSNVLSDTEIFMVEALGSAVINTACTRTVF